jgi:hypothetical protein
MNSAWRVGAFALLLIVCVSLGGLLAYQHSKTNALQDKVTELTLDLTKVNEELGQSVASCKATDGVVTSNQTTADEYDAAKLKIDTDLMAGIKDAQVKDEDNSQVVKSINSSTNAILTNSMWQSYCTVQPDDSDCTSRRSASKVQVR